SIVSFCCLCFRASNDGIVTFSGTKLACDIASPLPFRHGGSGEVYCVRIQVPEKRNFGASLLRHSCRSKSIPRITAHMESRRNQTIRQAGVGVGAATASPRLQAS